MNYKKIIEKKLEILNERKVILENDYDSLLPIFTRVNRGAKNHSNYTRMLDVTYEAIEKIDIQIELLQEIIRKAK